MIETYAEVVDGNIVFVFEQGRSHARRLRRSRCAQGRTRRPRFQGQIDLGTDSASSKHLGTELCLPNRSRWVYRSSLLASISGSVRTTTHRRDPTRDLLDLRRQPRSDRRYCSTPETVVAPALGVEGVFEPDPARHGVLQFELPATMLASSTFEALLKTACSSRPAIRADVPGRRALRRWNALEARGRRSRASSPYVADHGDRDHLTGLRTGGTEKRSQHRT